MRIFLLSGFLSLLIGLLPPALADYTCDETTGYYIDPSGESSSSSDSGLTCSSGDTACQDTYDAYGTDLSAELGASFADAGESVSDLSGKRLLARQDTSSLSCINAATCILFGSLPLCVDPMNGDFMDATGGVGNLNAGTYVPAGAETNSDAGSGTNSEEDPETNSGADSETNSDADSSGGSSTTTETAPSATARPASTSASRTPDNEGAGAAGAMCSGKLAAVGVVAAFLVAL